MANKSRIGDLNLTLLDVRCQYGDDENRNKEKQFFGGRHGSNKV